MDSENRQPPETLLDLAKNRMRTRQNGSATNGALPKYPPDPDDELAELVDDGAITVLIAEDDALIRDVLVSVINDAPDFEVIATAENAEEAITRAAAEPPDIALLDVRMPGGGGERAAREIAVACPETRIIALSAQDDRHSVEMMVTAGVSGYLTKDVPSDVMVETLRRCAAGETIFMPAATAEVMRAFSRTSQIMEETERRRRSRVERLMTVCLPNAVNSVFQPVIDLETGSTMMVEALARFKTNESLNTAQWFDEAVQLNMCAEIDMATLGAAIHTVNDVGYGESLVSLNVLPQTLLDPRLDAVLSEIDPTMVVIEVTEHARIADYEQMKQVLNLHRERGMKLAIDDAGAGYASLRHILDLMPDLIKLDITLSRNIDQDQARRSLAAGLISFAREIGAEIVAEGIETRDELLALRDLGVHYGQGYHLAMPQPIEQLLPRRSTA